jgi:hypothetical protein
MFKTILRTAVHAGVLRTETVLQEICDLSNERLIADDHDGGAHTPILLPFIEREIGGVLAFNKSDPKHRVEKVQA